MQPMADNSSGLVSSRTSVVLAYSKRHISQMKASPWPIFSLALKRLSRSSISGVIDLLIVHENAESVDFIQRRALSAKMGSTCCSRIEKHVNYGVLGLLGKVCNLVPCVVGSAFPPLEFEMAKQSRVRQLKLETLVIRVGACPACLAELLP